MLQLMKAKMGKAGSSLFRISDFKKGYQPKTNIVKDEGKLVADSHSIFGQVEELFLSSTVKPRFVSVVGWVWKKIDKGKQ